MFCVKCGGQIPDASAFCNKCGSAQTAATAPAPAGGAPPPAPAKDEPEQELWTGRFSPMSMGHLWLLWAIWSAVLGYFYFFRIEHRTPITRYAALALVALPVLYIVWRTLARMLTIRYRLTTQRLFCSTGFVRREMLELELIRVDDVAVDQNVIQRVFNVGDVIVIATDAVEPRIELEGIGRPIEVKEMIRANVQKRRKRVVNLGPV